MPPSASRPADHTPGRKPSIAREDLIARIEKAYDTELLGLAMEEVKARVKPHTWQAFHLLAIERLSGADVAARLAIDQNLAYAARKNVQQMIRDAITRLEGGGGDTAERRGTRGAG